MTWFAQTQCFHWKADYKKTHGGPNVKRQRLQPAGIPALGTPRMRSKALATCGSAKGEAVDHDPKKTKPLTHCASQTPSLKTSRQGCRAIVISPRHRRTRVTKNVRGGDRVHALHVIVISRPAAYQVRGSNLNACIPRPLTALPTT